MHGLGKIGRVRTGALIQRFADDESDRHTVLAVNGDSIYGGRDDEF